MNDFQLLGKDRITDLSLDYPFVQEVSFSDTKRKFLINYSDNYQVLLEFERHNNKWVSIEEYSEAGIQVILMQKIKDNIITTIAYEKDSKCIHFINLRTSNLLRSYTVFGDCYKYTNNINLNNIILAANQIDTKTIILNSSLFKINWQRKEKKTNTIKFNEDRCYKAKSYSSYFIFKNDYGFLEKISCSND